MNLSDSIVRAIRTYVPIVVGTALLAVGRWLGVEIDTTAGVAVLEPIVVGAYYATARWLESIHPAFGWLLGHPKG